MNNHKLSFNLQARLQSLGLNLDSATGHISYTTKFTPLQLTASIVLIRHGETYGNCGQVNEKDQLDQDAIAKGIKDKEKRVFQGNVDEAINQLNQRGKEQALDVALKLEDQFLGCGWIPDVIFHSPLTRAKDTGLPFVERNHFQDRYLPYSDIREISFGAWENKRVCDFPPDHIAHSYYKFQNALAVESGLDARGQYHQGQNFAELILAAYNVLNNIERNYPGKNIILFSHSLFGSACSILMGKGRKIENGDYLAFDGHTANGEAYCLPHATPLALNFTLCEPALRYR